MWPEVSLEKQSVKVVPFPIFYQEIAEKLPETARFLVKINYFFYPYW